MSYSFFTGAACALLLLAAARIGSGYRQRRGSVWLLVLIFGAIVYLLRPLLDDQGTLADLLIDLPTLLIPGAFWLFTHQLCSDKAPFPHWGWALIGLELLVDLASQLHAHPYFYLLAQPFKLGLIGAGLVTLLQQLQSDLVAERRQIRIGLLIAIGSYMVVVVCAEFLFSYFPIPAGIPTLHAVMASALAFAACLWLLALSPRALEESLPPMTDDAETLAGQPAALPAAPAQQQALDENQRLLLDKLQQHMHSGGYRHTGLTIRELAEQLGSREHTLRALINQHLGFRNFNEYLNQFRIDEASRRLADPDEAHLPVLTIALDIGYRSLSPFNAAFKRRHDQTPTEFRREQLPV
ncbi:helix-turn-helix transcriptional regulator [Microbulbifer hydrolyticus]|uniref:AraC-like DNA-binding protein n=1 Tax=Microbulbifer hydrolyticus TaxID=48074 RepID=A0A6P1T9T8_9GAMM|nr:helix-turn-helix transcriptional regulator [Microbulbifer hydrolyticus]MBB5212842.1 AraC-like DNA-binding protein [Microbulbifer hydrolyticus]QHQ38366.1 helix-turn-helix domain-containing protein [Microbulbifer hydrolyticus]